MVTSNIFAEKNRVKNTGDQLAVEFSLQSFKLEDYPAVRKVKMMEKLGMLKSHVQSQRGSPEMACSPLMPEKGQHECKATFWWYSIYQNQSIKPNVEYYPYGNEPNAQNFIWENYTINWTPELQRAVGPNGDLSRESVKGVFNGDTKNITAEMQKC